MEETTKSTHPPCWRPGRLGETAAFYGDHGGRRYIVPGSIEFAEHLIEAGVTVTVKKVLGAKHAFLVSRTTGYERAEQVVFQTFQSFLG